MKTVSVQNTIKNYGDKMKMLIVPQLSNYDTHGMWILEADSGWQMCLGRVRVMLDMVPDLVIHVTCPHVASCKTSPYDLNRDLIERFGDRLRFHEHKITPNALVTRYHFDFDEMSNILDLKNQTFDIVYINDPMQLRNFKALFHVRSKNAPKFVCHSHFIDSPMCPKFPQEASMWMGQVEAARKADINFWQCESSMNEFFEEMSKEYVFSIVDSVKAKSWPYDDGYSSQEITSPVNEDNLRFDTKKVLDRIGGRTVMFLPNRVGGNDKTGQFRSSDYTNCGKFLFDLLPKLYERRQDFVVLAGNPNQKFFNFELEEMCGKYGYLNISLDAFNRDEFKWVARHSQIAVSIYDKDRYNGTASRECIELGCVPLWLNMFEAGEIAKLANWPYVAKSDFSDFVQIADALIETIKNKKHTGWIPRLQNVVRERCSYEQTTSAALQLMGVL